MHINLQLFEVPLQDERKEDDITISIIREVKSVGLFQYFNGHGYTVTGGYDGFYYIEGPFPFRVQIIAIGELDRALHTWLKDSGDKDKQQDGRT